MKAIQSLIVLFGFVLGFTSCDIINPEEQVPAYLEIQPFTFNTSIGSQGSDSEKITEVWVFVEGTFLGVYDLPATVPVLNYGPTAVRLEAGIKENGLSSTPEIYPFYEAYEVTLNLEADQTEVVQPTTRYTADTRFAFIEDFEDNRPRIFTESIFENADLERSQVDVFEGSYSGHFSLVKDTRPLVELTSAIEFNGLQDEGIFVFLEVNYKSDAPVAWGIAGVRSSATGQEQIYDPGFLSSTEWNKIYFNLSPLIFDSQIEDYKIALQAFLGETSPDSSNVYLDNIKLVHF